MGWPIVLLATSGALVGRYLDEHLGTVVWCTLVLLMVGTVVGSWIAYRTLRRNGW